jgi:putative DNA primase/helicase
MNFLAFLQSSGFIVDRVDPDGKWHRCGTQDHPKTKNGAYKLTLDGLVGFMQNHATETEVTTWKAGSDVARPDLMISMQRAKEAREQSIKIIVEATRQAGEFWKRCKPLRSGHPYLDAKLLTMQGCTNLKIDSDGWLVIPVEVNGCIISLQRIAPDGTKRFWSGASVKGGCYVLARPTASCTVLCEGFATGLAIYQAVSDCRVIVCFDAGNMIAVANRLKLSGLCVVAADNDIKTFEKIGKNPGIEKGTEAAGIIGCGIAYPEGIQGSDYADMHFEKLTELIQKNETATRNRVTESMMRIVVGGVITRLIKSKMKFISNRRAA